MDDVDKACTSIKTIKIYDIVKAYITSIKNKDETVHKVEESRATSVFNRPNDIYQLKEIFKPTEVIIP